MKALRYSGLAVLALAAVGLAAPQAKAISITLDNSFFFESPGGVAFDPTSGNLFVTDGGNTISQVTTAGVPVSSFSVFAGADINGLDVLPNGNLLLADQSTNNPLGNTALLEFTKAGVAVPGGINAVINPPSGDADGVAFNAGTGTIFVADDSDETIYEFATGGGAPLSSFLTTAIDAAFDESEGITVDPETGNLLVVDDESGTSSLYELTTDGDLVMVVDLLALTGFDDPEGVTIDRANNKLYVAFDDDGVNSIGDRIAQFSIVDNVPEPATLAIFGLGLLGLGFAQRKRLI